MRVPDAATPLSILALIPLALNVLSPRSLIEGLGMIGVFAIVFAETGLLIGVILPGDSLLFLAGIGASAAAAKVLDAQLSLAWLLIGTPIAAIAGAQLGFLIGRRAGPKLLERPDSRLFKRHYVERAEVAFERFGPPKAVVLARFIPVVRTFLNPVAGLLGMPARTFFVWNAIGGLIWTVGVILLGYWLGDSIPPGKVDRYLLPLIAAIILVSLVPVMLELAKARRGARKR